MIKSACVYTYELDMPEIALEEIQSQLAEKINLSKNTVGILMCDPEFLRMDVYQTICKALPFPVVGATTMTQAVNDEAGMLMLTLMVLTSDDVYFQVGQTLSMEGDIFAGTEAAYHAAAEKLPSEPKLIMAFPPLLVENAGDEYIDAFEALCPNTPIFGTLAIDDTITFDDCETLYNGESSSNAMSFILVSGEISPRFLVAAVSDNNPLPYSGEITKSEKHIVYEINDERTSDYFESIGFAKNGVLDEGIQFVPFLLDVKSKADYDGVPIVRAMVAFDENGAGICRGYMYQNSVFTLTSPTSEDILVSSKVLAEKLNALEDKHAILLFPCMVRRMSFGTEPLTEVNMLLEKLDPTVPYMVAYSGGEICPTSYNGTSVSNRFHNYSLIACIL